MYLYRLEFCSFILQKIPELVRIAMNIHSLSRGRIRKPCRSAGNRFQTFRDQVRDPRCGKHASIMRRLLLPAGQKLLLFVFQAVEEFNPVKGIKKGVGDGHKFVVL